MVLLAEAQQLPGSLQRALNVLFFQVTEGPQFRALAQFSSSNLTRSQGSSKKPEFLEFADDC